MNLNPTALAASMLLALLVSSATTAQAGHPQKPGAPQNQSPAFTQGPAIQVFDTTPIAGGPYYVNDHTFVQAQDGSWHLFGIFHREPFGGSDELDFVHAVTGQPEPALWQPVSFAMAPGAQGIALHADRDIGETHVWAPHVVRDNQNNRYVMVYQGGGPDNDTASIRMAESRDLYTWKRVSDKPLFEDICVARDPMLRWDVNQWVLYYTRCNDKISQLSGVAYRTSPDLAHWSEPRMALVLKDSAPMFNSGYTESPFVFERGGWYYLSVTSYPIEWTATMLYRSRNPFHFEAVPFARLEAHAAEWISEAPTPKYPEGRLWMSHCGAGQGGVYLSSVSGL